MQAWVGFDVWCWAHHKTNVSVLPPFHTHRTALEELASLGREFDLQPLLAPLLQRLIDGLPKHGGAYATPLQYLLEHVPLASATVQQAVDALLRPVTAGATADAAPPELLPAAAAALRTLQHKYPLLLDDALSHALTSTAAADDGGDGDGDADAMEEDGEAQASGAARKAVLAQVLLELFQVGRCNHGIRCRRRDEPTANPLPLSPGLCGSVSRALGTRR